MLWKKRKLKKLQNLQTTLIVKFVLAAFEALGEFPGDEYALEICQNTIRDNDPAVRLAVAKALKKIGNDHVVEALRHQMLHETDEALKKAFEDAMDACRERRFLFSLISFHDERNHKKESRTLIVLLSLFMYNQRKNVQTIS